MKYVPTLPRTPFLRIMLIIASLFVVNFLHAQEEGDTELEIKQWLKAGPHLQYMPAFHQDSYKLKDLVKFSDADVSSWQPAAGDPLAWDAKSTHIWETLESSGGEGISLAAGDGAMPEIVYLATYLTAERWLKADLEVSSRHLLSVFLDGKPVAAKESSESDADEDAKEAKHTLKLETGKHLLLIKALRDPENSQPWTVTAKLKIEDPFTDALKLDNSPSQVMNIHHLLDGPKLSGVSISADGSLAAVSYRRSLPPSDNSESWMEIRDLASGKLVQTFRGKTALSSADWAPKERKFAYTNTSDKKSTLWVVDLDAGSATPILEDVENFGGFYWSPDGSFIVYTVSETPDKDDRGVLRLESPRDRLPGYRTQSYLYRVNIAQGTRQRLTAGALGTYFGSFSPDGKQLVFSQTVDDFENRPYTKTTLYILNLSDLTAEKLLEGPWLGSADWSPDGKSLLITGSPRLFGDIGVNVPDGMIPNDYDTQAYLYDLSTKKASAITHDFNPTIDQARWGKTADAVHFLATDGEYIRLFKYSVKSKEFNRIETEVEVISGVDIARNAPQAVYYGASANTPPKAYHLDLSKGKSALLSDPGEETFSAVKFGEVKRWTFQNKRDVTIEGRVYYPPNFDPAKTYPAIVYYYGGTSVVERNFGGRYPMNLFAAQGYVMYVLQPSGAPGFSQEFSAYHVNDWGDTVGEEIITGTKEFLKAHPFVDAKRVGCIGASYGGFMTMSLITKTDIYSAAISHAGISVLASYWGEGNWGYLYSSAATANSFPWNRKDIYVDNSPLYNADKVNTPILLLHGDSDTNVPRGESDQFYVALKLLGKEVEYVRVEGQDHHIINYNKRIIWQKTIFAWFDRLLKDQPEWWDELYPAR